MIYMKRLVVALVAAMFMIWPSLQAADGNVKARQLAKFQDEASQLASLWIEYALGDPDFVPNLEEGTVDCQLNQPQPSSVTILTGNFFGGETVRSCTVPADVPLFFPILNCFFINFEDENFSRRKLPSVRNSSSTTNVTWR